MKTLALCAALTAGCAFSDGEPFAVVTARLEASAPVPEDRALEDGWQRLASDYQVRLEAVELEAGAFELVELGGGGIGFDPANPPPGYSLCHNGHCHSDEGGLVSYEEIAAELAGSGGEERVVMQLPVGSLELVGGVDRELSCVPDCELPLTEIGLIRLPAGPIRLAGQVRDSRAEPRFEGELDFEGSVAEVTWIASTSIPADREADPEVGLVLGLELVSRYLDGVDFAALPRAGGAIDLSTAADEVARGLEELELAVSVER